MASNRYKFLLLTILIGVPVIWYLFLQSFGKNEFLLPRISEQPVSCEVPKPGILILSTDGLSPNHISRLKQNAFTGDLTIDTISTDCFISESELILVDLGGYVVGEYDYSTKEIDRLIIEVELMKKIEDE